MSEKLVVSAWPHITGKRTTRGIMLDVLIALIPAVTAAVIFFGITVLIMLLVCAAACVAAELLFCVIRRSGTPFVKGYWEKVKKSAGESSIFDCSAVVTGVLLALNLPVVIKGGGTLNGIFDLSGVDWGNTFFLCILGSVFAIVIVKMLFGGIGKNFANPALTARIFLILAFSAVMTKAAPNIMGDATTAVTWLNPGKRQLEGLNFLDMFLGVKGSAAAGETSVLALLIGGVYLSVRKVIDFRLPLMIIGSAALFALVFNKFDYRAVLPNILSGGLFLGAIFMATDYSSSPNTVLGSMLYGFLIGFLTIVIRKYSQYPEGVSFAIVMMNIITPLIDKYIVPLPFGRKREREKLKNPKPSKEAA